MDPERYKNHVDLNSFLKIQFKIKLQFQISKVSLGFKMEFLFLHYHGNTDENAKLNIHVNIGKQTGKVKPLHCTYSLKFKYENSFGFLFIYIKQNEKKTRINYDFFC